jgi:ferredoxin
MAYVITDSCIKCKYMDCVEVCPVDCFYEGENMLAINPDECIDCGVCQPECPVQAIMPDTTPGIDHWQAINRQYSKLWPSVTRKGEPRPDADQWKGIPGKFEKHFSVAPGSSKAAAP